MSAHRGTNLTLWLSFAAALSALPACGGVEDDLFDEGGDGIDDSFLGDNKSDAAGLTETSPEAAAVLRVANESTVYQLRYKAQLGARAAASIVTYCVGEDGIAGTADDRVLTTLQQLDDIPFVGTVTFHKLLAYARRQPLLE